jgi:hypothetical protein
MHVFVLHVASADIRVCKRAVGSYAAVRGLAEYKKSPLFLRHAEYKPFLSLTTLLQCEHHHFFALIPVLGGLYRKCNNDVDVRRER